MEEEKMFLTKNEVVELTGFIHVNKQCEYLSSIGFPFSVRADNRVVVLRSAVQGWLGGDGPKSAGSPKTRPNFYL